MAIFRANIRDLKKRLGLKICYGITREVRCDDSAETTISLVLDATETLPLTFSTLDEATTWLRLMRNRKGASDTAGVWELHRRKGGKPSIQDA